MDLSEASRGYYQAPSDYQQQQLQQQQQQQEYHAQQQQYEENRFERQVRNNHPHISERKPILHGF